MVSICLNMIVKNESNIITRLLDSVLTIIDCYCICDTGSDDNTISIIKDYFNCNKIPGKIIYKTFLNFSHNRNYSLSECYGMSDYILLLDADMILDIKNFNKNLLIHDYYYLFQGSENFTYSNIRIIKNNNKFKYIGYTHEYIFSESNDFNILNKDDIFINDIGDGGSKIDKFKRDIDLLNKNILEEPDNSRLYFYLATSYKNIKDYTNAIKNYNIVLNLNGWIQEKFCSCYDLSQIYYELNNIDDFIKYSLKTIDYDNERIEGIVNIVEYYYNKELYLLVNLIYHKFKNYKKNFYNDNKLFLENYKYNYLLEYYNSISAFYVKDFETGYICCKQCINNNIHKELSLLNIKYYENILESSTSH